MNLASLIVFFLRLKNQVETYLNPGFETKLYLHPDYFGLPQTDDASMTRLESLKCPRNKNILQRYPRASVIALLGLSLAVLTAVSLATHGAILPFMPFLIKGLATAIGAPMISAMACHSIGLGFGLFCAVSSITWAARGMVSQSTTNKRG